MAVSRKQLIFVRNILETTNRGNILISDCLSALSPNLTNLAYLVVSEISMVIILYFMRYSQR